MKLNIARRRGARIEMLPLIDIVFLLLVFFIYAMLSMAVHRALPVALPKSGTAEVSNTSHIAVSILQDGHVFIDQQAVELASLQETLQHRAVAEKEAGVQVFADSEVDYQHLFTVLDAIKGAGISKISLQAEKDGGR